MTKRLSELSPRDLLVVGLPLLLLLAAGFWGAAQFIRPAPPDTLVLSSGGEGGAYQRFASAYKETLAHYGVRLIEKPSAGSLDNLQRLRDDGSGVDAGFFQAGTGQAGEGDALVSLGSFYHEPLWIFYRQGLGEPDRILQLKGRRIAIGGPGSGTHHLALEMLGANGLDAANTRLLEKGGLGLVEAFGKGEIDAAFVVGPTESATVWSLLFTPGVRLMSLAHADAYTRRLPHLSKIVLSRGAVDVVQDIPVRDVTLVASAATLLVREDMHPALIDLLLEAAIETHGGAGIFQKPGDFPRAMAVGFPLSGEAARYHKSGKPLLQRYLPFWAATLVDRMVVMLIPVIALLLPVFKFAPSIYTWRVRSRIYRRYGELKFIEAEVESDPSRHTQEEWLDKLDAIEADANRIPTPLAFADMLYTLKGHIGLVREAVLKRTTTTA
ncbi:MAG: ABC transporter substrate-binding protein [Candidatus Nitricoxidivorans perseverans]|uniref:ABC transporter substrate-binding protein n=1 Tax=Candidatus Nitricoxidivorans perseverans TaxID=2975601 RepID=A0AA49FJU2_9PROT|nr:MAG: ABC transporter substrate-binding protein [Candidatus Nitricoxidivorans perseverans]